MSGSGICRTDPNLIQTSRKHRSSAQLHAASSAISSLSIARVDLSVADEMKVLSIVLDRRVWVTFVKDVVKDVMAQSYEVHTQAICHICHLLSTDLATTLVCSLILSRLDYCNLLLHGAPTGSILTLQCVQNNALPPGSSCRLRGDRTHGRFCVNSTGCQFITEMTIGWLWWLTISAALQHRIYISHQHAPVGKFPMLIGCSTAWQTYCQNRIC